MELFLDDPNIDVDTPERKYIIRAYIFCFLTSIIPLISLTLSYLLSITDKHKSDFSTKHFNNLFKLQLIILISTLIAIVLYVVLDVFYFGLFVLFILLFQCIYTYKGISAAKAGMVNNFPISF